MDNKKINALVQSYVDELFAHDDMSDQENIEAKNDALVMCMAFAGHILEKYCIVPKKPKLRGAFISAKRMIFARLRRTNISRTKMTRFMYQRAVGQRQALIRLFGKRLCLRRGKMKEHYVSYECAVKLKELGFDLECYDFYTEDVKVPLSEIKPFPKPKNWNDIVISGVPKISCPRLDQVAAWLREKHHLSVEPICNMVRQWNVNVCKIDNFGTAVFSKMNLDTYESALSAGIDKALELLGKEVKE